MESAGSPKSSERQNEVTVEFVRRDNSVFSAVGITKLELSRDVVTTSRVKFPVEVRPDGDELHSTASKRRRIAAPLASIDRPILGKVYVVLRTSRLRVYLSMLIERVKVRRHGEIVEWSSSPWFTTPTTTKFYRNIVTTFP